MDDLFERDAVFAAAPDTFPPDRFNAGVLLVRPDEAVFADMLARAPTILSYDGGDTGFLNAYFPDWCASGPAQPSRPAGGRTRRAARLAEARTRRRRSHPGSGSSLSQTENVTDRLPQVRFPRGDAPPVRLQRAPHHALHHQATPGVRSVRASSRSPAPPRPCAPARGDR